MARFDLADFEWPVIAPLLPKRQTPSGLGHKWLRDHIEKTLKTAFTLDS